MLRAPGLKSCLRMLCCLGAGMTILAAVLVPVGCGRKASPVPPGTIRPKAIQDLRYRITPKGVELSWSVPVRNRDGSPLARIQGFEIRKAEVPTRNDCDSCPPPFGRPIVVPFDAKPEEARRMIYEDRTVRAGFRYIYDVRTVKGWFNVSDPSNRVSLVWHVPPGPPTELKADVEPEGVALSWNAPTSWADGTPLSGDLAYRISRARTDAGDWRPLGRLVEGTRYFDPVLQKGVRYRYRVSAVFRSHDTEIEGLPSPETTAVPGEAPPPMAPGGLVAVATPAGVELLWRETPGTDIVGYYIYRQRGGGLIDRLNHAPVPVPRFVDRTLLPSGRYTYWVTAVGTGVLGERESRQSAAAEVEIQR